MMFGMGMGMSGGVRRTQEMDNNYQLSDYRSESSYRVPAQGTTSSPLQTELSST